MTVDAQTLFKIFAYPEGPYAEIVGDFMLVDNLDLNLWTLSLLKILPEAQVLEAGFGPGLAIEEVEKRLTTGKIVGIDPSAAMFMKAKARNQIGIDNGKVELKQASVQDLPSFEHPFDAIIAINSLMYWQKPVDCLKHLYEIMKPGGILAVSWQRRKESFQQKGQKEVVTYGSYMHHAGFIDIQGQLKDLTKPVTLFPMNQNTGELSVAYLQSGQVETRSEQTQEMVNICLLGYKSDLNENCR